MDRTGDEYSVGNGGHDMGPLTAAAAIVGKKWHPRIVVELLRDGPLGFNDLKESVDGISDKVLSESLDDLQERDIVHRTVIDDKPVRVEYSLTEWGEELEQVVTAMDEWGTRYLDRTDESAE
ncbi:MULTISPECIES: winged helix-turn-helix transcriptional regulator [Halomicrobium]|uniref:Transcriptional regulator, HxlR family n=2 Tax=Halomicrobium mukohataei TaxID=57705 RepID=C7NX45_HALMD|nr:MULTISPECIES: helix-turn-helix domain-containing protein [Halomicrobium]ACV46410.1 transcriptional regulator, HxlR family [Halomicrobium mukohataei DSM 12286]QCD64962.1 helix-turn-helix transcriptional regulator [Halomicrobium mukohataei]QFR19768.1 transcriptional regulator [Halomicrobium sp. ZPS1]